jgi:hypothetical protein
MGVGPDQDMTIWNIEAEAGGVFGADASSGGIGRLWRN